MHVYLLDLIKGTALFYFEYSGVDDFNIEEAGTEVDKNYWHLYQRNQSFHLI